MDKILFKPGLDTLVAKIKSYVGTEIQPAVDRLAEISHTLGYDREDTANWATWLRTFLWFMVSLGINPDDIANVTLKGPNKIAANEEKINSLLSDFEYTDGNSESVSWLVMLSDIMQMAEIPPLQVLLAIQDVVTMKNDINELKDRAKGLPVVDVTTMILEAQPGVYYKWDTGTMGLFYQLAAGDSTNGYINEYYLEIIASSWTYNLAFSSSVIFPQDPVFLPNKRYQISIVNNIALVVEVDV